VVAPVIARLARYIDDRMRAGEYARKGMQKVFPEHWSFLLGEIALYSFVVLLVTGIFLALFFKASYHDVTYTGAYEPLQGQAVSASYNSVLGLVFDVPGGLLMRQIHHWAALVFVGAIVVHLLRIFFTGAFRRPRELNWLVGATLLVLGMVEGFAGYSMPDDLLSGVGLRIGFSVMQSIPIVGSWLAFLVFGGEFPSPGFISRLYIGHVFIIPLAILGLISVHLFFIIRQKHTQFPGTGRTNTNVVGERFWPTYAAKSVGLMFLVAAVLAALGGLVQINPVWLYGPFDPTTASSFAQPDWYMGWLEGSLRLMPSISFQAWGVEIPNVFFSGVLIPGVAFTGLYLYPFVEQRLTGAAAHEHHLLDRPREHPYRTALGVAVVTFFTVLMIGGSDDIIARITGLSISTVVNTLRTLLFALPVGAWVLTVRICGYLQESDRAADRKEHLRRMETGEGTA
jgi:ubiquinol-cytochrome c reductase cytochrome b subunit